MFPDPIPLDSFVKEEGDETKAGGGLVQHDGQEHDHLHVGLVGGCGRPQRDPVRSSVNNEAEGRGPTDAAPPFGPTDLQRTGSRPAGGDLVNDQHEDEPEDERHTDEVMTRVLMFLSSTSSCLTRFMSMMSMVPTVGHVQSLDTLGYDH